MVFNATSNNISVDIVVVSFTEGENHRPTQVTDKLYHIIPEWDSNVSGDRHWLHR